MFSPLLSPKGRQQHKTGNGAAPAPTVEAASITSVAMSVIISFPRAQRRTALYQSLPVPALPISLAPRLPSSSSSAAASFEESLLELDRRRAVYYQIVPTWVESNVLKSDEPRAQRPAEDLLPDPFVTVNEWNMGDEAVEREAVGEDELDETDDGTEDGEESQASRMHDSLSASAQHLRPSPHERMHHSPASRPRPSPSPQARRSVSSLQYVERGNLQRRTPHSPSASPSSLSSFLTLQHPAIPRNMSNPHLMHYVTNSNSRCSVAASRRSVNHRSTPSPLTLALLPTTRLPLLATRMLSLMATVHQQLLLCKRHSSTSNRMPLLVSRPHTPLPTPSPFPLHHLLSLPSLLPAAYLR